MSGYELTDRPLQRVAASWPDPRASDHRVARAAADASDPGVSCRLGDASCASAHATTVSRSALGRQTLLQRSLLGIQRRYGNHFVGQVLRRADAAGAAPDSMDVIERAIEGARGAGHGMDHGTRGQMESAFGADFSGVRIHTDSRADGLSQSLSARAFTTGRDVFFRHGEYSPGTSSGRELLAHELTHVVQQNGDAIRRKMTVSEPGDPHEVEADQMARAVIAQENAPQAARQVISRQDDGDEKVATKRGADTVQRQPEAPTPADEEDKKKLHARLDADLLARRDDDKAPAA